ncbi:Heterokaryon incompatibility protein 6- OR allele [Apiospora marii]|uniref:Heterokaryon incompatibility protein 6- OR allele n=1 Tax=Apiospora marii TaxID=335849 RepID=A0ABR1R1T1_9PEZI
MSNATKSPGTKNDQTGKFQWANLIGTTTNSIVGDKGVNPAELFRWPTKDPTTSLCRCRHASVCSTFTRASLGRSLPVSLRTVDLAQEPTYQALSYTWDKDPHLAPRLFSDASGLWDAMTSRLHKLSDVLNRGLLAAQKRSREDVDVLAEKGSRRKIVCGDRTIYVTANLYDALQQLRRSGSGAEYWIDALCINQQDTRERDAQVGIMHRIYSQVRRVVIWLGTSPSFLDDQLRQLVSYQASNVEHDAASPERGSAKSDFPSLGLVYMLHRRWFSRVWVVQEICAAQEALFMMGDHQIPTECLIAAIQHLKGLLDLANKSMELRSIDYRGNLNKGVQLSDILQSREHRYSIEDWTQIATNRKASKPCDMLYGGLSMIEPASLVIDQALQLQDPLPIPRVSQAMEQDDAAPPPLPPRPPRNDADMLQIQQSTDLATQPLISADGATLYLEAAVVEVLHHHAATTPMGFNAEILESFVFHGGENSGGSSEAVLLTLSRICLNMLRHGDGKHGTLGSILDAFTAETWRHDSGDDEDSPPLTPRQREIEFCHFLDSLTAELDTGMSDQQKSEKMEIESDYQELKEATPTAAWPGADAAADVPQEEARRLIDRYRRAYRTAMRGRSVFVTKEGRFALVPCWAAERDVVSIITKLGFFLPFPEAPFLMLYDLAYHLVIPQIMLVRGAAVPYVFTPIDEYLVRLVGMKLKSLKGMKGDNTPYGLRKKERIQQELLQHQAAIGQRDAYVLVGEAYIDGNMYGESPGGLDFGRIEIV